MPWSDDPALLPFVLSIVFFVAVFIVAAATVVVVITDGPGTELNQADEGATAAVDHGSTVDPTAVLDPHAAGDELPAGYRQLLPRDFIRPVYRPRFTTAADIDWPDDADVIGVSIDGEAKAYPVSFLNGREMVLDELAGEPLLVSW